MKLRSAKAKGSRLEREWASLLRGYGLDINAKRMPMSGAIRDSRFKADIITTLPLHFELKNEERWSPLEYFRQACSVCEEKTPVVVMSRNREQLYVFMLGTDWLRILQAAIKGGYTGRIALPKTDKKKKFSLEEGANLEFSKMKQVYGKQT